MANRDDNLLADGVVADRQPSSSSRARLPSLASQVSQVERRSASSTARNDASPTTPNEGKSVEIDLAMGTYCI